MRIKVMTLGLAGALLAGLTGLVITVLRSGTASSEGVRGEAEAGDPRARLASRLRARSLPKFNPVELTAAPAPLAPEAFSPPPLPPPPNEPGELRERASRDGYIFREAGNAAVYMVQNGTKFHIKTPEDLRALGYSWDRVEVVPPNSLTFLRDRPPEKTLMRERDQHAVYYFENGQKRWISSPEMLQRMGHTWADVKVVPSGALGGEATGSPIQ